jgi:hypothetical protein
MAATYNYKVDSFRIYKTGAPGGILTEDPFNDGIAPPDASETPPPPPQFGTPSYTAIGGMAESGGKLIFDSNSALGLPALPSGSDNQSALTQQAIFNTNINTTDPEQQANGLKRHHEFAVEAIFDLTLPDENQQEYGVRFTDIAPSTTANAIAGLAVHRGTDGRLWVDLTEREGVNGTITVKGRIELTDALIAGADQIKLTLSHAADTDVVTGKFELITNDVPSGVEISVGGAAKIFDAATPADNYTRAGAYAFGFNIDQDRATYVYEMDGFRVERNGVDIMSDGFGNGNPPGKPMGGAAMIGYNAFGNFSEVIEDGGNGVLVMDSSQAGTTVIGGETLRIMNATWQSDSTNATNGQGLKINDDFAIYGRFNLILPQEARSEYGIRFTDQVGPGTGDDVISVSVRMGTDGIVRVVLVERNLTVGNMEILGSVELTPELLENAVQIGLGLHHDNDNPGAITAGFRLFDENGDELPGNPHLVPGVGYIFGKDTATTADDEVWTRPQIFSTGFDLDGHAWIEGLETDDELVGTAADEHFHGHVGNDRIIGGGGTDTIYGGSGNDTVVLSGNVSDYTITAADNFFTLIDNRGGSPDGTINARGVENFEFADATVGASLLLDREIQVFGLSEIVDGEAANANDGTAFGDVDLGSTATQTFTINNLGGQPLTISNIKVPTGFTSDLTAQTIPGGTSITFEVSVDTSKIGNKSGKITFDTNDTTGGENKYDFGVSAKVVPVPVPDVTVTGTNPKAPIKDGDLTPAASDGTDFGKSELNQPGTERVFTIKNDGDADLEVFDLRIEGTGFLDVEGFTDVTLAPGETHTFKVALDTSVADQQTAQIRFTTNDPDESDYNFGIKGFVTTTPDIEVEGNGTPIGIGDTSPDVNDDTDFGAAVLGSAPVIHTFTVNNTGNAPLTVQSIKVPAGFTLIQNITAPIPAGGDATFDVQLSTGKPGTFAGDILIVTNDPDEKNFKFKVTGNVTQPEIDVLGNLVSIKDNSKKATLANDTDFGAGIGLDDTVTRTFTISNAVGAADLHINSIDIVGVGATRFELLDILDGTILAGGQSVDFEVLLKTDVAGKHAATIRINNNDANEGLYDFAILGTVGPRNIVGDFSVNPFEATVDPENITGTGGPGDTVSYENATGPTGVTASLLKPKANTGFAAGDLYTSIENLIGTDFDDKLTGDTNDNALNGGKGADILDGGAGNDILEGGEGGDKLIGGAGIDIASYENATAGVTVNLLSGIHTGDAQGDTYNTIEIIRGSSHDDVLIGNKSVNRFEGGAGEDEITGGLAIDTLTGGLGADTFIFTTVKDGGGATQASAKATGDLITDFVSGEDFIGIARSAFKIAPTVLEADFLVDYFVSGIGSDPITATNKSGVAANGSGHAQFLFNETTDQLWWIDGTAKGKAVLLATFTNGETLLASDFVLLA